MTDAETFDAETPEGDLVRLLDPDLSDSERRRLEARLAELGDGGRELRAALDLATLLDRNAPASRRFCPDRETLARGADSELHEARQVRFDRHVKACPWCAEDVADFRLLARPTALELVVRLGREALGVIENSLGEVLEPTPVPAFRGLSHTDELLVERRESTDEGEVRLRIALARTGSEPALHVRLERDDARPDFSILLYRDGQVLEGRSARRGELLIESLRAGEYELVIQERASEGLQRRFESTVLLRLEPDEPETEAGA